MAIDIKHAWNIKNYRYVWDVSASSSYLAKTSASTTPGTPSPARNSSRTTSTPPFATSQSSSPPAQAARGTEHVAPLPPMPTPARLLPDVRRAPVVSRIVYFLHEVELVHDSCGDAVATTPCLRVGDRGFDSPLHPFFLLFQIWPTVPKVSLLELSDLVNPKKTWFFLLDLFSRFYS